jgi:hypothetical protein
MNKKLPMLTVRICGIDVNVEFSDPTMWANAGMGRCSQKENRIAICNGMDSDVEGATFLHEVIHMIADMNELRDLKNDETTIAVLANALNAFLKDNELEYWGGGDR